jgi:hypothetical protein
MGVLDYINYLIMIPPVKTIYDFSISTLKKALGLKEQAAYYLNKDDTTPKYYLDMPIVEIKELIAELNNSLDKGATHATFLGQEDEMKVCTYNLLQ